jgi:hypothetical protein
MGNPGLALVVLIVVAAPASNLVSSLVSQKNPDRSNCSRTLSGRSAANAGSTGVLIALPPRVLCSDTPRRLVRAVGNSFVPSVVEGVEQTVFDFGGDVGVGLGSDRRGRDPAVGIGRLRDAVGDHPSLVAMPQPVERQPGFGRFQPHQRRGQVPSSFGGRAPRRRPKLLRRAVRCDGR